MVCSSLSLPVTLFYVFLQENVDDQIQKLIKLLRNEHNWLNGMENSLCTQKTLNEDPDELTEQLTLNKVRTGDIMCTGQFAECLVDNIFISRRRRRPGDGRYCNAPRPSVRLSVRPSHLVFAL